MPYNGFILRVTIIRIGNIFHRSVPNPGHRDDPVIPIIAGQKEPSPRRDLIIGKIGNHTASTSARVSLPLNSKALLNFPFVHFVL